MRWGRTGKARLRDRSSVCRLDGHQGEPGSGNLAFQVMKITDRAILCVNLRDQAQRKRIEVDVVALSKELGVPVVGTVANRGKGLPELVETIAAVAHGSMEMSPAIEGPVAPAPRSGTPAIGARRSDAHQGCFDGPTVNSLTVVSSGRSSA